MVDRIHVDRLTDIVATILERAGAERSIATEVADNLVEADIVGRHSHGARLTASYVDRLKRGVIDGRARPEIVSATGSLIRIDGRQAFGQIVGQLAAATGARAAKEHGVAVVAVTNSGQFGRNGKWAEIAAGEGIASLHFVNGPGSPPAVVPFGAREGRLGTNPIAIGAPRGDGTPFVVDFSVGEVAGNIVKLAYERGERLPRPSIMRADGALSDDPADFMAAGMKGIVAFGGYKGTALALFADIFAGALTGGGCQTGDIGPPKPRTNNMLSIFLNPEAFVDKAYFGAEVDALLAWVRSAAPASDDVPVTVPGDRTAAARMRQEADGIVFDDSLRSLLAGLADTVDPSGQLRVRWPELSN